MRRELISLARQAGKVALPLLVLAAVATLATPPLAPPFGKWTRVSPVPIVSPRGDGFESAGDALSGPRPEGHLIARLCHER